MSRAWVLLSGEYPPSPGGVADYTRAVAEGLAGRGHEVHVVAPSGDPPSGLAEVHPIPSRFGPRGLRELERVLAGLGPRRLFLQYVPHAFGYRALNFALCAWLVARAERERIWTQFHEVAFPWRSPPWRRTNLLAAGHRAMAAAVCRASARRFVTTERWEPLLAPLGGLPAERLPVPSNVGVSPSPAQVAAWRARLGLGPEDELIGHFGTYGRLLAPVLCATLPALLARRPAAQLLLLGRGGPQFASALSRAAPELAGRIQAPGPLPPDEVAAALAACSLCVQPYEDGVTSRRGSLMACLGVGAPVLTTQIDELDPLWTTESPVALSPLEPAALAGAAAALLAEPDRLVALGRAGAALYQRRFALERTLERLESCAREEEP